MGNIIKAIFFFVLGFAAATVLFIYYGEEGMRELGENFVERVRNWKSTKW